MSARWPVAPAAVVLDVLDAGERPHAERLLREDAGFRAEVERLRAVAGALRELDDAAWRPVAPPPAPVVPGRHAAPRRARPAWTRRLVPAGLVAAAAATVAAVVTTRDDAGPRREPAPLHVALALHGAGAARARLLIDGDRARLQARDLRPNHAGTHYEAWLADARGRMISMGTFRIGRSGSADVRMPLHVDVRRYAVVDVSLERDDGNPAHSTVSVLRARI